MEEPLWIPSTLYGGVIKQKYPPWGRPPAWEQCPGQPLSFFFGVTQTSCPVLELVSSNLMGELEVVALYKKVSPRPCDYTVTKSDEE